jgi:hypothetical protein
VLAGALGLALACDLVIAKEGAEFGTPEINVGAFPFMIMALIYRNVPRKRTNELLLLGERIDARAAKEAGIQSVSVSIDGLRDTHDALRGVRGSFDAALELVHRVWKGELVEGAKHPIGPAPVRGAIPILIGGTTEQAVQRVVKWGVGYTVGGAGPDRAAPFIERVRKAWAEAGREGEPRIVGLTYFGLAEDALDRATRYLGHYYGEMGEQFAQWIPKTPDALRDAVRKFEDFGFDELFLDPTTADLEEIDRATSAVF